MTTVTEGSDLELLVLRAASGDDRAWHALWRELEPELDQMIGRPSFLGRIGLRDDERRNIIVEVLGRLAANDRKRLRDYVETRTENPHLRFMTWLRVVAKRVGIDYQRGHSQYLDRRRDPTASSPGKWVEHGTLGSEIGAERPPMTDDGTAHEIARAATSTLPEDQRAALELWAHGESYEMIAKSLGLSGAPDAEKKVRAAIERLRRRFRGD